MKEFIIINLSYQVYKDLTRKTTFFEGWSWRKFNNLGPTLGTNLNFYTSVAKGLKLKVRKLLGLISTFVEVTGEKLVGAGAAGYLSPQSWIGLRLIENWEKSVTIRILLVLFFWISPRLLTVFLIIYLLKNFMHMVYQRIYKLLCIRWLASLIWNWLLRTDIFIIWQY